MFGQPKSTSLFVNLLSVPGRVTWQDYRWLIRPVWVFLLTSLIIFGAAAIGQVVLPTDPGHWSPVPDNPFLENWAKWDSQFYAVIARAATGLPRSNKATWPACLMFLPCCWRWLQPH